MEVFYYGLTQRDVRLLAFQLPEINNITRHINKETCLADEDWLEGYFLGEIQLSHCAMNGLNLTTSKVNSVAAVRNAMGTMETTIAFVTDVAKRSVVLQQAQRKTGVQQQRLTKLCQTRFVERHTAVRRFCEQFSAIVDALKMMGTWSDPKTSSKATMLVSAMGSSDFLAGIVVLKTLAGLLRPVSLAMQEQGADLVRTMSWLVLLPIRS